MPRVLLGKLGHNNPAYLFVTGASFSVTSMYGVKTETVSYPNGSPSVITVQG